MCTKPGCFACSFACSRFYLAPFVLFSAVSASWIEVWSTHTQCLSTLLFLHFASHSWRFCAFLLCEFAILFLTSHDHNPRPQYPTMFMPFIHPFLSLNCFPTLSLATTTVSGLFM
ncbi:hypothetical protein BDV06DRAFT_121417 [Aspergillus oleicola]